ncbi:MAG: DUF1801 domain-containing protein, partial [Erysipelotrichaceae bacterium]|nr:DUF1801 domain-containing protein [Erysipelotrichaceae bacterium]
MEKYNLSNEVTALLDNLEHPLRNEINYLRSIIMSTGLGLSEGVKWNGPNYSINNEDRVTIRINPFKQIQVIFHRGAKVKEQPKERLLKDEHKILTWKENDRAIATFKRMDEIERLSVVFKELVIQW